MLHSQGLPFAVPQILSQSAAAVSCPVDTSEDILATITVPANALGANGALRISTEWSCTNNANLKTIRIRYSGIAGTQYLNIGAGISSSAGAIISTKIANRNATNSQEGSSSAIIPAVGIAANLTVTSAVDTTVATTLVITGQKATAGDTLTLDSFQVEILSTGT